jgi:hypothetical protein
MWAIVFNIQNARLTDPGFGIQAIAKKAFLLILPVNAFFVFLWHFRHFGLPI